MAYCDCAPGDGDPGLVGRKISNISDEEGDWSGHNPHSLAESTRCSSDSELSMGNYPSVVHTPRSTCAEEGYVPAPGIRYTKSEPLVEMDGNLFPSFWRSSEVQILQNEWAAREGDVFVVSQFPIRGIQRLMVALVEGEEDPWKPGLIDKAHFCDAGASRVGAREYMDSVDGWTGRRCFKTHVAPSAFPCRFPFERPEGPDGPAPKVVVLVADPRHLVSLLYDFHGPAFCKSLDCSLSDFIRFCASGKFRAWGDFWNNSLAWSEQVARHPGSVQMFDAGKLGSLDLRTVTSELERIAEFLEIPKGRAADLAAAAFRSPDYLVKSDFGISRGAVDDGLLLEQSGKNLHSFEAALNSAAYEVHELWRNAVKGWLAAPNSQLAELARISMKGVSSTPPLNLTVPMKGEAVHASGMCRPCVFALRGICNNADEMCLYCHASGHTQTKRASLKSRQRKTRRTNQRIRTPSPSPSPRGHFGELGYAGAFCFQPMYFQAALESQVMITYGSASS
mmetsp:Transcript_13886/g.38772  ORF Transcript_13886/g.38772 Transcript_13886/m.38772 type:complete len:507 (+) Transcript_13886:51-1571(+)